MSLIVHPRGYLTILIKPSLFYARRLNLRLVSPGTGSSILSALQDLPSVFWPVVSKMEKHLQVISVLQWVISFLAMGECVCACVSLCISLKL